MRVALCAPVQIQSPHEVRPLLLAAFTTSGHPDLLGIHSLHAAQISFLNAESKPEKVDGATRIIELRAAKALRVVVPELD